MLQIAHYVFTQSVHCVLFYRLCSISHITDCLTYCVPNITLQIVQYLLKAGSRTDLCQTCSGQSPLFAAINTDYTEAVDLLIKAG